MARDYQLILRFDEFSQWCLLDFTRQISEAMGHVDEKATFPHILATTLDDLLFTLWRDKTISVEDALAKSKRPDELAKRIVNQKRRMLDGGNANPRDGGGNGNSRGGGAITVVIHTNDPLAAFAVCRPLLERHGLMQHVTAAWSGFSEQKYTVIWPEDYVGEFRA